MRMKTILLMFIRNSYVSLIRNSVTGPLRFSTFDEVKIVECMYVVL